MLVRILSRLAGTKWFYGYATGTLPGHRRAWRCYSELILGVDFAAQRASGEPLDAYLAREIPSWREPVTEAAPRRSSNALTTES
jgi:hypothetical protein